jgi:uncharacterized repeat protein (TIGR03803 family)
MKGKRFHFVILWLLLALVPAPAQTFSVLHTFTGPDGAEPISSVILDGAGNIYGTTPAGGDGNCSLEGCGTVFVLNKAGKEIALHSFKGTDGAYPHAGLMRDSRGNIFGTTVEGGSGTNTCGGTEIGCGVAFRFSSKGKEAEFKFQGPNGDNPESSLVEDAAGNLYGTTVGGGKYGWGAVFKIDGTTGKESVLYSFSGGSDGCFPVEGLTLDSAGNLYGVTAQGGEGFCTSGEGVLFEVDPAGNETVLHTFGGTYGAYPSSVPLFDSQGNLYGTTAAGGSNSNVDCSEGGCGTVFELTPQQGGLWAETVLYSFCSLPQCADGESPGGGLARDVQGNIFGTTYRGGSYQNCPDACGVVFELTASGTESVLHNFTGRSDGADPMAGLAMDSSGNLYGTTQAGGASCYGQYTCGVVFKITP